MPQASATGHTVSVCHWAQLTEPVPAVLAWHKPLCTPHMCTLPCRMRQQATPCRVTHVGAGTLVVGSVHKAQDCLHTPAPASTAAA
jgi:hypothetical protein